MCFPFDIPLIFGHTDGERSGGDVVCVSVAVVGVVGVADTGGVDFVRNHLYRYDDQLVRQQKENALLRRWKYGRKERT